MGADGGGATVVGVRTKGQVEARKQEAVARLAQRSELSSSGSVDT